MPSPRECAWNNHLIKLKEPGLQAGSFNFRLGGEEKSTYEANFITGSQNMLDAPPTSLGRLVNAFYEAFLISLPEAHKHKERPIASRSLCHQASPDSVLFTSHHFFLSWHG
jgi:hypothetical protein